ncbi:hypothetical protein Tco_0632547, partial [Tanacetum coccineum]
TSINVQEEQNCDLSAEEYDDERVVLATLIANLQLDTEENKKIQKQLKKANTSLAQELKECKFTLEETNKTLRESNRTRDRYLVALHDKEIPYDKDDLANIFAHDREETLTLEQESRSKLNKDIVKPYNYTKQNSLYENFKLPSREYLDRLALANEVRKKM